MRWIAMWGIVVLVLFSIDVSTVTATRNPLHHPGHHYHHDYNHDYNHENNRAHDVHAHALRGGSTILQPPPPPMDQQQQLQQQESSSQALQRPMHYPQQEHPQQLEISSNNHNNPTDFLPKLGLEQITKALLHTSEWNRKFLKGVRHWGKRERLHLASKSLPNSSNCQQQSGSLPVNVHPSRTWRPPIQPNSGRSLEEEELTLFHAKKATAAQSWGPDLLPYLKHITQVLEMKDNLELVLAMVYLDRACSLETPRSNGIAHLPFLQPRTVHRLGLAALVVAKSAMNGNSPSIISELSESLGIPTSQLQLMVEWMVGALGDEGLYVGLEELKARAKTWESFLS